MPNFSGTDVSFEHHRGYIYSPASIISLTIEKVNSWKNWNKSCNPMPCITQVLKKLRRPSIYSKLNLV